MRVYNIHCPPAGAVLDREDDDTLILVITAEDHGSPENTGSVTMTITLLDENDNPPTFVPPFGYAVVAPEDEPVGSVLLVPVSGYTACPSPLYIYVTSTPYYRLLLILTCLVEVKSPSEKLPPLHSASSLASLSTGATPSTLVTDVYVCMGRRYSPSMSTELLPIWSPCLV